MSKLLTAWLPVLFWCGVIFSLSSLPTLDTHLFIWYDVLVKKAAHVTEFAVLAVLVYRALKITAKKSLPNEKDVLLGAFIFSLVYAISDEFHQQFTPGRQPQAMDVGIDFFGILTGLWVVSRYKKKILFFTS